MGTTGQSGTSGDDSGTTGQTGGFTSGWTGGGSSGLTSSGFECAGVNKQICDCFSVISSHVLSSASLGCNREAFDGKDACLQLRHDSEVKMRNHQCCPSAMSDANIGFPFSQYVHWLMNLFRSKSTYTSPAEIDEFKFVEANSIMPVVNRENVGLKCQAAKGKASCRV